ncbi:hypothetical protein HG15A2_48820 [Adhaeretor mobilis]|uniref:Uncharacterized protein n=1 Tax=Adhaeretor mobilis TaxID=1930276 RepID=A0A517N321_9BACT|nr:hypothetical protein HG15A2_48820 [Adhaeretor mobilis]
MAISQEPLLTLLRAITAAGLLTTTDAQGIEGTTDDLVTNTGKIANTTTAYKNDAMLLQRMTFAGDINGDFLTVRQSHTRDLAKRGVRLLGGHRPHLQANTPLLRAALKDWRFAELPLLLAVLADELIDCWHNVRCKDRLSGNVLLSCLLFCFKSPLHKSLQWVGTNQLIYRI